MVIEHARNSRGEGWADIYSYVKLTIILFPTKHDQRLVQLTKIPKSEVGTECSHSGTFDMHSNHAKWNMIQGQYLSLLARLVSLTKRMALVNIPDRHWDKQRHFHATHACTFEPV